LEINHKLALENKNWINKLFEFLIIPTAIALNFSTIFAFMEFIIFPNCPFKFENHMNLISKITWTSKGSVRFLSTEVSTFKKYRTWQFHKLTSFLIPLLSTFSKHKSSCDSNPDSHFHRFRSRVTILTYTHFSKRSQPYAPLTVLLILVFWYCIQCFYFFFFFLSEKKVESAYDGEWCNTFLLSFFTYWQ
jgi:hypothetical protein